MTQETIERANELIKTIKISKRIERLITTSSPCKALREIDENYGSIPIDTYKNIMGYIKDQMIIARMKAEKELEAL